MTSDNKWDPSDIQLPHHSLVIGALECSHPEKYTDNPKYDVLTGSIYSIYTEILVKGLSDEAATVSATNTKYCPSKLDAKTLAQICRIGLGPAQNTLKTTTQVGVRFDVHSITRQYKTDIIHGYNERLLNTTIYFDTLFSKFR